jgi:hypothetical protein
MAKINEQVIVIRLSKLVRDNDPDSTQIAGAEIQQSLEQVVQELVGESVIVELASE